MKTLLLLATLALAQAPAGDDASVDPGITEPPLGDVPAEAAIEARTEALSTQLRCPVCQGLSVAASPSPAARAMRDRVRSLVAEGYTDEQITAYFVDRYGTWVLLAPPAEGVTWLLWLAPAGAVLAGLGFIGWRSLGRGPSTSGPGAATLDAPADPYRARILDEMNEGRPKIVGKTPEKSP